MKKRILSLVAAFFMIVSPVYAEDAKFRDVQDHWAESSINWAVQEGIVKGFQDNTFRPNQQVTEAEFLAMLIRLFPNSKAELDKLPQGKKWTDNYYSVAKSFNIPVLGYKNRNRFYNADEFNSQINDGNYQIHRGVVAQMIAGSLGHHFNARRAIAYLYDENLSQGRYSKTIHGFDAYGTLTRAEAVTFLKTIADQNKRSEMKVRPSQGEPDDSYDFSKYDVKVSLSFDERVKVTEIFKSYGFDIRGAGSMGFQVDTDGLFTDRFYNIYQIRLDADQITNPTYISAYKEALNLYQLPVSPDKLFDDLQSINLKLNNHNNNQEYEKVEKKYGNFVVTFGRTSPLFTRITKDQYYIDIYQDPKIDYPPYFESLSEIYD